MSSTSSTLNQRLEELLGCSVELRINRNRKTMLSILEKGPRRVRLSIHEIFLKAPHEVVEAAAKFVDSHERRPPRVLQFYIDQQMQQLPPKVSTEPLLVRGVCYDLEKEWQLVNSQYFQGTVELDLTWFGSVSRRGRSRLTLGIYDASCNLIRVHRLLDTPETPAYYLHFLLYHEALHKLYPPYLDPKGVRKIHHETFKRHEKRFREYTLARRFEQSSKQYWFAA